MKPPELSNSDFEMQIRKSYIKPRIERVSLVPEETVLAFCKGPGVITRDSESLDNCGIGIADCIVGGS